MTLFSWNCCILYLHKKEKHYQQFYKYLCAGKFFLRKKNENIMHTPCNLSWWKRLESSLQLTNTHHLTLWRPTTNLTAVLPTNESRIIGLASIHDVCFGYYRLLCLPLIYNLHMHTYGMTTHSLYYLRTHRGLNPDLDVFWSVNIMLTGRVCGQQY